MSALHELFGAGPVAVLTGAGVSTDSGIPDYRGPETARRSRNPVRFQQFVQDPLWRQRYWARSCVGWPRIRDAQPNACHHALSELARAGVVAGLITQNVDRLHAKAGLDGVELHGALAEVVCLSCGQVREREALQQRLLAANPDFAPRVEGYAPDGDADLSDAAIAGFEVVDCDCGGLFKPHVVFFGESVPRARVERAKEMVAGAKGLLVVGSSLTVFSGFRFVRQAEALGIPVAILNRGQTRGDPLAALKVDASAGPALSVWAERVGSRPASV